MEKDIDRIPKNPDTDIVIRVDDFGGKRGITIREFVRGERYTGFTKAGTRIPADQFKAFKQAINSIDEKEVMEEVIQQTISNKTEQNTINEKNSKSKNAKLQTKNSKLEIEKIEDIGEEEI